jgi:hypothetical protein
MGDILWLGPLLLSPTCFVLLVEREVERFWIWEVGCGGAYGGVGRGLGDAAVRVSRD